MNDTDLLIAARPHVDGLGDADKQRLYAAITGQTDNLDALPGDLPGELIAIRGHEHRRAGFRHVALARAAALLALGAAGLAGLAVLTRDTPDPAGPVGSSVASPTALPTTTASTDSLQDQILADGVVTEAELVAAQDATVACITAGGFEAYYTGSDGHQLVYGAPASKADAVSALADSCEAANSTRVSLRYASGHLPSDFDLAAIWTCMRAAGLVAPTDSDPVIAFQQAVSIDERAAEACIKLGYPG